MKKLAAVLCVVAMTGCSFFKSEGTAAKTALIDCAKQDLGATVTEAGESILATVVTILAQGGTNWVADLTALGAKYGADAVSCAEKVALALFQPAPGATPATTDTVQLDAFNRAKQSLAGKSFK